MSGAGPGGAAGIEAPTAVMAAIAEAATVTAAGVAVLRAASRGRLPAPLLGLLL